jgi:hypothetical protein
MMDASPSVPAEVFGPTEAALQVRQCWAPFIERWGYAAAELDSG